MSTSYSITPQSIKDFIIRLVRSLRPYQTTLELNNQDWLRINDWFNKYELSPVSSPLSIDDFYSIYVEAVEAENRRRQAEAQEEGSLDPDPDLTDGDDDLQNGTVPPPSDKFNESLRANVEALDEAFNQIITQLEERGVPEEEIEAFRKAVTPVYEGFGSRTMGQPGGSIPIDIPDSPMPKWERGSGVTITWGDPDNPSSGNDDIYITLHLELPVIGKLLKTLGVGGGKIYLRKGGKWSTPGDVLERVGGIFTDILKTPKAILDEAKKIIEGIEDGTVFEGIKREEGLFADLLKKWLIGRYPWFEDEWFKDFIKQAEELARQSGLLTLSELNTEEKCNATGTHIWDETTDSCLPKPEVTEEEQCVLDGNRWDRLANNGEGKCVEIDDPNNQCPLENSKWSEEAQDCVCEDGYIESVVDGVKACIEDTTNQCPLENSKWSEEAQDCVCIDGYELKDGVCAEIIPPVVCNLEGMSGGVDENGKCECKKGWHPEGDICVKDTVPPPPPPPEGCPIAGEVRDPVTGECGPPPPPPPPPPPGTCPANSTPNADGGCDCNAGFTWDSNLDECVPDVLPPPPPPPPEGCPIEGEVRDPETGKCGPPPPPPTSGGGGGGGMFSPQPVNLAGGINYALPPFVQVDYKPKDYVESLNKVIQESLFEGMI